LQVTAHSNAFRGALASFATGVTVVTTVDPDGRDIGLTVNSFNSVSLDPPLVLWSLARTSTSLAAFQASKRFAIHVLSAGQQALSSRFASRKVDRFEGLEVERGEGGVPLLAGCAARFQCRTEFEYDGGDHVIFVGEVAAFDHSELPPLVFHGGGYAVAFKRQPEKVEPSTHPESNFSQDFLGYLLGVAHYGVSSRVRTELMRHGLTEEEYLILGLAGATGERTLVEIDDAIKFTGLRATTTDVDTLAGRGVVKPSPEGYRDPIRLTESGRALLIRMAAFAKAAEADAEEALDYGERQILRLLLRRLIRDIDPIQEPPGAGEQPAR
jgi:3-hydroxy-9,10-secoandrosta-1,3,5(10)-triene-9,17-dione monooxygenase reductase component